MGIGAQDFQRVRDVFQRSVVSAALILVCMSLPVVLVSYWVFLLCCQSAYIASTSSVCLAIGMPTELAIILYTLINKTIIANHKVFNCSRSGAQLE